MPPKFTGRWLRSRRGRAAAPTPCRCSSTRRGPTRRSERCATVSVQSGVSTSN
jgi:hypothetical protein